MVQQMFEQSGKELEFFRRVLDTDAFREIIKEESASKVSDEFSKATVLDAIRSMLHSDFDDGLRRGCLEAMGRVCCQMFLEYSGLGVDTDINTYAAHLRDYLSKHTCTKVAIVADYIIVEHSPGIHGHAAREACRCPIIVSGAVELTPEWCICGKSFQQTMYEAVVKQPVEVELMDSPLTTNSDRCRWLIFLRSPRLETMR